MERGLRPRDGRAGGLAAADGEPPEAVAVLRDALEDESELVREHARWALERALLH